MSGGDVAPIGPSPVPRRRRLRRGDERGDERGPVTVVDIAVCAAVAVLGVLQLVIGDGGAPPVAVVAVAATTVALLGRRAAPIPVAAVVLVSFAAIVVAIDEPGLTQVGPIVALYGVGQRVRFRAAVLVAVLCGAVALVLLAFDAESSTDIVTGALLVIVSIAGGQAVSNRLALVTALQDRLDAVGLAQDLEVERRVLADRLRLAQELHDVIAHTITVVNIQASVALRHARGNEPAEKALGSIRTASAQALDELRTMLGVLRSSDETIPVASAHSIIELVRSLDTTRLQVRASIEAEQLDDVPPALMLAAYRLVQEGLTNVIRHSTARHAHVAIGVDAGNLLVTVHDPGPASTHATTVGGFGLAGIRERVTVLGGTFTHGSDGSSGFTLRATIPLTRPA